MRRLLLAATAAFVFPAASRLPAQTLQLQPGSTVWDDTTANWVNSFGTPTPWSPGAIAVIGSGETVSLIGSKSAQIVSGGDNVSLSGSPLQVTLLGIASGTVANALSPSGGSSISLASSDTAQLNLTGVTTANTIAASRGRVILSGAAARFNAQRIILGSQTPNGPVALLRAENGAVIDSTAFTFSDNCTLAMTGAAMTTGGIETSTNNSSATYVTLANSTLTALGDVIIGRNPGGLGFLTASGCTLNISGNLTFGFKAQTVQASVGGTLNIGGTMRLADAGEAGFPTPTVQVQFNGSTIVVADTAGRAAISGTLFEVQPNSYLSLTNTTLRARNGGLVTVSIPLTVDDLTVDTNGGSAVLQRRITGRRLLKTGAGILSLRSPNGYGSGGVVDGTIVRGGFIEFNDSLNFGPGNFQKNIQLDNGGLRWAPGNSTDISSRLRLLNNASYDTNGNNVNFFSTLAGTGGMTKLGAGMLTLSASNTFSGGLRVLGGVVAFNALDAFGTGGLTLDGGGVRWLSNAADITARLQPLGAGGGTLDTNGNDVTFSANAVSGPGALTKIGVGTLTFNGTHPWTGDFLVNGGLVAVNGNLAGKQSFVIATNATAALTLGTGSTLAAATIGVIGQSSAAIGTVNVGSGALLQMGQYLEVGSSGRGTLTVSDGGRVTVGATTAAAVVPGANGAITVTGSNSSLESAGAFFVGYSGSGNLSVGGGGSVTAPTLLLGFTTGSLGVVGLEAGGTISLGGTDGLRGGPGSFAFYLSGGTLRAAGSALTSGLPMTLGGTSTLDTNGLGITLSGVLDGAGGLKKVGAGTLVLTGTNSYNGGTTLTAGTLAVNVNRNVGFGPISVQGGSLQASGNFALDVPAIVTGAGSAFTTGGFLEVGKGGTGSLNVNGGATVSGASTVSCGILPGTLGTIEISGAGSTLSSAGLCTIGYLGTGSVVIGSGGALTASAGLQLGTLAGGSGTLRLNAGGALLVDGLGGLSGGAGSSSVELAGGTFKVISSPLSTAVPMTLSGVGPLFDTSGASITLAGPLSGNGQIAKTGGGPLVLGAANALTGATALIAGTIRAVTPTSLGTGALRISSGTTLELPFSGTATVQSLAFDGVQQAGGTWGSLTSTAANKSAFFSGPGLLNVIDSIAPPTVNAATTAGLSYARTASAFDLFAVTGAAPAGGVFSGPGVSGSTFDPAAAGYGAHDLVYTLNGATVTFTVAVTGGLTLDETGGSAVPSNLAPGGTAFAKDVLPGTPFHTIAHLNDGAYGNGNSWIGASPRSFAGVSLGAVPVPINRIAFGRDNNGFYEDRCVDFYLVQVTTEPNPSAATTAWTSIGAVDYRAAGGLNLSLPARRHVFGFAPVVATGVRIVALTQGTALDELEIYPAAGLFATGGLRLLQEAGSLARSNQSLVATSVAFAKDVLAGSPNHTIAHLNDGAFGNGQSWIGATSDSFAGIAFSSPRLLDRVAFGRDNTAAFSDRTFGRYTLQYTTVPSPDASTPEASWTTIGFLDYQSAAGVNFGAPSRRHLFAFPAVTATGVRILTPSGAALDELEFYLGASHLTLTEVSGGAAIPPGTGSYDFGGSFPGVNAVRTFQIANAGTADFELFSLFAEFGQTAEFVVGALSGTLLPPGGTATYTVTFTPGAVGPRSSTINLASNDPVTRLFTYVVNGTGLAPTLNAAANAGLSYPLGGGAVDLASATAPNPPGGVFSGPGVSGGNFTPATAGLGLWTLTYTVNGASVNFEIAVTGGLTLEESGGAAVPGNLAPAGTAFAKDVFPDNPNHTIAHLNDALYGNTNSWIGASKGSFAGVSLGAAPVVINRIAFGRDNTGLYNDRCQDVYVVQVTLTGNPDASTPTWTTIGAIDFRPGGGANLADAAQRHVFSFAPVATTGVRIVLAGAGTALDEIEIYAPTGVFSTGGLRLVQELGAFAPLNLAREAGAVAFAKDAFVGSPNHTIAHLNDGQYGNAQSWIGASPNSFAGIRLAGSRTIDRLAFGRDNTGALIDRTLGRYTIQYTTVATPDASTPDASWTTIGFLDYQGARSPDFVAPGRRHLFAFPPVTATGMRIVAPTDAAIDEIEIYQGAAVLGLTQGGVPVGPVVDFGEQPPGGSVSRLFTVTNSGSGDLVLQSLTTLGANGAEFVATNLAASSVPPGGSTTFSVTFTPTAAGARSATLQVASNDLLTPFVNVNLTGTGLTPLATWRLQNFNDSRNLGAGADTADPNANGLPNLLEYALGGNPVGAASAPAILPQVGQQSGRLRLSFTRYYDRNDVTLTAQGVDSLTGLWVDLAQSVAGAPFTVLFPGASVSEAAGATSSTVTVLDAFPGNAQNPRRFLRLRVSNP